MESCDGADSVATVAEREVDMYTVAGARGTVMDLE